MTLTYKMGGGVGETFRGTARGRGLSISILQHVEASKGVLWRCFKIGGFGPIARFKNVKRSFLIKGILSKKLFLALPYS